MPTPTAPTAANNTSATAPPTSHLRRALHPRVLHRGALHRERVGAGNAELAGAAEPGPAGVPDPADVAGAVGVAGSSGAIDSVGCSDPAGAGGRSGLPSGGSGVVMPSPHLVGSCWAIAAPLLRRCTRNLWRSHEYSVCAATFSRSSVTRPRGPQARHRHERDAVVNRARPLPQTEQNATEEPITQPVPQVDLATQILAAIRAARLDLDGDHLAGLALDHDVDLVPVERPVVPDTQAPM